MLDRRHLEKKILIIDDEVTIRFLLKEMLSQIGFNAQEASNKKEAIHMVHATTFDLIFVDMVYANADYNGFEIIDMIKKYQPLCQVVILTARPSVNSAVQALRCRIFDYLEKPICLDVLTSVTISALDHAEDNRDTKNIKQPHKQLSPAVELTDRELDILHMLAKGFSYAETAEHLNCKISTVQWHIKNIYKKLGVSSKSEAVYEALCMKLVNIQ